MTDHTLFVASCHHPMAAAAGHGTDGRSWVRGEVEGLA